MFKKALCRELSMGYSALASIQDQMQLSAKAQALNRYLQNNSDYNKQQLLDNLNGSWESKEAREKAKYFHKISNSIRAYFTRAKTLEREAQELESLKEEIGFYEPEPITNPHEFKQLLETTDKLIELNRQEQRRYQQEYLHEEAGKGNLPNSFKQFYGRWLNPSSSKEGYERFVLSEARWLKYTHGIDFISDENAFMGFGLAVDGGTPEDKILEKSAEITESTKPKKSLFSNKWVKALGAIGVGAAIVGAAYAITKANAPSTGKPTYIPTQSTDYDSTPNDNGLPSDNSVPTDSMGPGIVPSYGTGTLNRMINDVAGITANTNYFGNVTFGSGLLKATGTRALTPQSYEPIIDKLNKTVGLYGNKDLINMTAGEINETQLKNLPDALNISKAANEWVKEWIYPEAEKLFIRYVEAYPHFIVSHEPINLTTAEGIPFKLPYPHIEIRGEGLLVKQGKAISKNFNGGSYKIINASYTPEITTDPLNIPDEIAKVRVLKSQDINATKGWITETKEIELGEYTGNLSKINSTGDINLNEFIKLPSAQEFYNQSLKQAIGKGIDLTRPLYNPSRIRNPPVSANVSIRKLTNNSAVSVGKINLYLGKIDIDDKIIDPEIFYNDVNDTIVLPEGKDGLHYMNSTDYNNNRSIGFVFEPLGENIYLGSLELLNQNVNITGAHRNLLENQAEVEAWQRLRAIAKPLVNDSGNYTGNIFTQINTKPNSTNPYKIDAFGNLKIQTPWQRGRIRHKINLDIFNATDGCVFPLDIHEDSNISNDIDLVIYYNLKNYTYKGKEFSGSEIQREIGPKYDDARKSGRTLFIEFRSVPLSYLSLGGSYAPDNWAASDEYNGLLNGRSTTFPERTFLLTALRAVKIL